MRSYARNLKSAMAVTLLLGMSGCSASPSEEFKQISDGKKAQLTQFLRSKQSRLMSYEATVTEETNVDRRSKAAHAGRIEFSYPVTKPVGESESQGVDTVVAHYEFLTDEKKWRYKQCVLELSGAVFHEQDRFVTFQEVAAAFEK